MSKTILLAGLEEEIDLMEPQLKTPQNFSRNADWLFTSTESNKNVYH